MSFESFRRSFYYGSRADMQFKYLASMNDEQAADAIARLLAAVGEAFDTGDWDRVRQVAFENQLAGYQPDGAVEPEFDTTPFTPLPVPLDELPLALISAGGVYRRGHDPEGPDGPSQNAVLGRIKDYLRSVPTLLDIRVDTATDELTARHPGYDATTAQRDPNTVFPLEVLRDVARDRQLRLASAHYAFVGAASQIRLREEVGPRWAQRLLEAGVGAALLVAT